MVKTIAWFVKAGIAGVIALGLLSAFTIIYSYSGVHIANDTGTTDYKWESNQFRSNMSEGFSWIHMNEDGFNNSFNLADTDHVDILLMGSSHMEAVNVSDQKNVGYLLNQMMPEMVTYNIGISGHTIYRCVSNLKNAVAYYNPQGYVIIETDMVDLDENMMREVIEGELPVIQSYDKGLIYKVQKFVPCFQLLYRQIGNWVNAGKSTTAINETDQREILTTSQEDSVLVESSDYNNILDDFIQLVAEAAAGRKVIIVYHPKTTLNEQGILETEQENDYVYAFQEACDSYGIEFIDMYDDFRMAYEANNGMAHGFINTAVGVGHLNTNGHRMIADRIYSAVKEFENGIE